ncbi:WAP four-disulfide core domain protein 8-like [Ambystoma mexicanum]|uniref:WAP four-disulfide core domain protein 8-like n=1 Tax=Ambystoma mexicanum TaxID=8296 RepID=UPI0037E75D65
MTTVKAANPLAILARYDRELWYKMALILDFFPEDKRVEAMEILQEVKPGACPAAKLPCTDYSTPDNCTDDGDCEGRKKCCEGCGKHCTSPDPVKPGACPDIKASCLLPLPKAECKDDLDCGGLKKCCKLCGNQCMNPASVRPGFCPVDLMLEQQCARVLRNNCTNDGDCGVGEKCCLFGCGMQCVMALDVAPGSCPGIKAKCDPENLATRCKADDDCDPKEKCCELCGKQCLPAVSDHTGFCPVSRFHIGIVCTPKITQVNCTSDLDCPPRSEVLPRTLQIGLCEIFARITHLNEKRLNKVGPRLRNNICEKVVKLWFEKRAVDRNIEL